MQRREMLVRSGAAVWGISAFPLGWVAAEDKRKPKILYFNRNSGWTHPVADRQGKTPSSLLASTNNTRESMIRCTITGIVAFLAIPLAVSSAASHDNHIKVTVGQPFTIASAPPTFIEPHLHQLGTDPASMFCVVWSMPDDWMALADRKQTVFYTHDGGRTWGPPTALSGLASGGKSSIRLNSGTCLWLGYFTDTTRDPRTVSVAVGRSTDGGSKFTWTKGNVVFPQKVLPWKNTARMSFSRSIIQLSDDSLLATMYGQFASDPKYRSVLVRSTDGGTNWNYYSTIAYAANAPGEGYCEPVIQRTADGNLLAVMRLGSFLTMQSARSADDGRTWSVPSLMPDAAKSVEPDLFLMSNGILAMSYGRHGDQIMFSLDGNGKTWTSPTTIYNDTFFKQGDKFLHTTYGYTSIKEVSPGRLLYVYDFDPDGLNAGSMSYIKGVYIDVTRVPEPPRRQNGH